jgi:CRISPR-associated protein Cas1
MSPSNSSNKTSPPARNSSALRSSANPISRGRCGVSRSKNISAPTSGAKALVRAKLWNSDALVADYRSNHPSTELDALAGALLRSADQVVAAANLSELLGYEGSGTAAYFAGFSLMNRSELPFDGRAKHPPPDPVNALLSLGYTMLMNEIRSLVEGAGLEPHLGFLHRADYGRPSLALDLLEPFRSVFVDRLT